MNYKPLLHFLKVSHTGNEWTFGDQLFEDLARRSVALAMKKAARLAVKPPLVHGTLPQGFLDRLDETC